MSKYQTLRDLVYERLTAAAEEIFALVEMTIVEYEEELCRCRVESQIKQQRLDQVLNPCVRLHRMEGTPPPPAPSGPFLNQEITETAHIKEEPEEQRIKEEEQEQPPLSLPESSAVYVKNEESTLLLQIQAEHRGDAQGEDISSEPLVHSRTDGHTEQSSDNDNDWEPAQMETEANGDYYNQVQITDISTGAFDSAVFPQYRSAPGTSHVANDGNMLETGKKAKNRNHQCAICLKRFRRKMELQRHIRVHTGERPYSCSICAKTFTQKIHLDVHTRTHNSEKPYSCSICSKTFSQKIHLEVHLRTHTGERPYKCSWCKKTFTQRCYLQKHMKTHREENHELNDRIAFGLA